MLVVVVKLSISNFTSQLFLSIQSLYINSKLVSKFSGKTSIFNDFFVSQWIHFYKLVIQIIVIRNGKIDNLETRAVLLIFSFELEISGMAIQRIVRPKIGNWEKHLGKHKKYQKKLGNPKKTGETIGETWGNVWGNGGNMQGTATRRISYPLSHQFSNCFIHCRFHPRMTALCANQYIAVHFFMVFSHAWYLVQNLS